MISPNCDHSFAIKFLDIDNKNIAFVTSLFRKNLKHLKMVLYFGNSTINSKINKEFVDDMIDNEER